MGFFGATELIPSCDDFPCYNNSEWSEKLLIDGLNPIENNDYKQYNQSECFDFDWNINEYSDFTKDNKDYDSIKDCITSGTKMTQFVVLNKKEVQMMIDLLNNALKVKGCDLDD